jgi:hemerythrin
MSDNKARIKEIIEEHHTIRGNVKLVGDSVSDQEALNSLKSTRSDWVPGQLEILSEKRNKLQQTINFLDEGLRNHFAREEEVLPAVLGGFLMQALRREHQEIEKLIHDANLLVVSTNLEGLSQEELTSYDSKIKQTVSSISRLIEGHTDREDIFLEMVWRVLEEGG